VYVFLVAFFFLKKKKSSRKRVDEIKGIKEMKSSNFVIPS